MLKQLTKADYWRETFATMQKNLLRVVPFFLLLVLLVSLERYVDLTFRNFTIVLISCFAVFQLFSKVDRFRLFLVVISSSYVFLLTAELMQSFVNGSDMYWVEYFKVSFKDISVQILFASLMPINIIIFDQSPVKEKLNLFLSKLNLKLTPKAKYLSLLVSYLFVAMPQTVLYFAVQQTVFFALVQFYYKFNNKKNKTLLSFFFISYISIYLFFNIHGLGGLLHYFRAFVPSSISKLLLNLTPSFFYFYLLNNHSKITLIYDNFLQRVKKYYSFKKLMYISLMYFLIRRAINPAPIQYMLRAISSNSDLEKRLAINSEQAVITFLLALKNSNHQRAYSTLDNNFNKKSREQVEIDLDDDEKKQEEKQEYEMINLQFFSQVAINTDSYMGKIESFLVENEQCTLYAQDLFGTYANEDQIIDFDENTEFFTVATNRQRGHELMQIAVLLNKSGVYKITHINDCRND